MRAPRELAPLPVIKVGTRRRASFPSNANMDLRRTRHEFIFPSGTSPHHSDSASRSAYWAIVLA
jgi:hypothetical protein